VLGIAKRSKRFQAETAVKFRYTVGPRRGTQVVRERSAKPLYVGSIPTRASINTRTLHKSKDAAPKKSKTLDLALVMGAPPAKYLINASYSPY
jgi:hypothetical protein